MLELLTHAQPLDGLLVAPHGATVSTSHPDADGYWLSAVRHQVGPDVPILGTLDAHANLSPAMIQACDGLVAYRTNPHLDQYARGVEAARLMVRTLRGEIRPVMAAAFPPLVINIERQRTEEDQWKSIFATRERASQQPRMLSASVLLGFPYADVPEMGAATIAVADQDSALAAHWATELGAALWNQRAQFLGRLLSVEQAIEQAREQDGPVCLLDMGDNVGGGAPGDGTLLIRPLHNPALPPALACLCDPEAVRQASLAGPGAVVRLAVGGKTDRRHGAPLEADYTIVSLHNGTFQENQPRHGGFTHYDQGATAVLRSGNVTLVVTSRRMPPFSLNQLTICGVDPRQFQFVVVKGVHAPQAAYQEVCRHFLRINTPGVTTADLIQLNYRHRRRPLFPFEDDTSWTPTAYHR
jgi:microcystin degradation protein MlrC